MMRLIVAGCLLSAVWLISFARVLAQATLDNERGFAWTVFAATGVILGVIWREYISSRTAEFNRVTKENAELTVDNATLKETNKTLEIKLAVYEAGKVPSGQHPA